ncbi:nitrate- and nitrite sensing domain-containing protein [Streptomyces sp. TP-A0356]|uniref:nitrate- and nitrite sensing domain-containing protein n=1 Tax=Streptomyces sp. TP-A0356 TaxID=1359208 RepID=UPI000A778D28|nr:nitrate- and nitrite sensing domain-containing protein [Streptomyces sp. TP-A0356]
MLVLALAVLLALLGAAAADQLSAYRNAAATARNARLAVTLQALVHELQKERGLTTGYVGGVRRFGALLPAQRRVTDTARARLGRALRGRDDAAAASVRASLARLDALAVIRRHVDEGTRAGAGAGAVRATFDRLTTTITVLNRLAQGLDDVYDRRLRAACQTLQVLGNAKEFTDEERALVLGPLRTGRFRADDYSRFLQIRAGRFAALESFPRTATGAQQRRLDAALATPAARRALAYENVTAHGDGRLGPRGVPAMSWWQSMTSTVDGLRDVQISLGRDVEDRAAALEGTARCDLLLFVLFALGTVVILGHLALDCVRTVSTPLAALAEQTREVAGARLPRAVAAVRNGALGEPPGPPAPLAVSDRAGAEVRDVAVAFDRVQRLAFDLAIEQAVLRRNADGVLVVAGESGPPPEPTPLSVTDVLRAALMEVEAHRRVGVRHVEPAHIVGCVVAETARLLAGLIERALTSTPPDSDGEVEVQGTRTGTGYLLSVVDHGGSGPTGYLGDFAVGAFARTGGAEVRLAQAPAAGVVARVLIPVSLLTEPVAPRRAPVAGTEPAPPEPVLPAPRAAAEDAGALVPEPALQRSP